MSLLSLHITGSRSKRDRLYHHSFIKFLLHTQTYTSNITQFLNYTKGLRFFTRSFFHILRRTSTFTEKKKHFNEPETSMTSALISTCSWGANPSFHRNGRERRSKNSEREKARRFFFNFGTGVRAQIFLLRCSVRLYCFALSLLFCETLNDILMATNNSQVITWSKGFI